MIPRVQTPYQTTNIRKRFQRQNRHIPPISREAVTIIYNAKHANHPVMDDGERKRGLSVYRPVGVSDAICTMAKISEEQQRSLKERRTKQKEEVSGSNPCR